MAGYDLTLELDPADRRKLEQLIANVAAGVSSLGPFFDAVEMHMIDSLTSNFEAGGRPMAWSPLAPATIEMKGSSAILQDRGHLKQSVNAQNTQQSDLSLKIFAGEAHGAFHQYPDVDPGKQFGMTNKKGMPMRPFMLFQDSDIKEIESILGKYIDDIMK